MHLPIFILSALALAREAAAVLASGPRISPPAGCKIVKQHTCNSTQYSNISAAVASLTGKSHACIFVYPGNYTEQVTVSYGYGLAIYGYTTESVTSSGNGESPGLELTYPYKRPVSAATRQTRSRSPIISHRRKRDSWTTAVP